jgi:hypothetical protein
MSQPIERTLDLNAQDFRSMSDTLARVVFRLWRIEMEQQYISDPAVAEELYCIWLHLRDEEKAHAN